MTAGFDLTGRRVVLTGAGQGLGSVLAAAFDAAGADLTLVARTESKLVAVADQLIREPLVLAGDVREAEFNEFVAARTMEHFGGLDVWISNAGISPQLNDVTSMDPDVWRDIVDTNLTGVFLGSRAAAAVMGPGGRIIATGSVLGDRPRGGLSAYSGSKAGVHSFVQALAIELGPKAITVNAVAPGWFDAGLGVHWRKSERRDNHIVEHTALGRWGTAEDLPGAYLFLASHASAYITGTTITVDGGYSLL